MTLSKFYMSILRTSFFIASISLLSACNEDSPAVDAEKLFTNLSYVHNSPDYPADEEVFLQCLKESEENCHRVINHVKYSVNQLSDMQHNKALALTLESIDKFCKETLERNDPHIFVCEGAINALYLFNDKNSDDKIIEAFSSYSKLLVKRIFYTNRAWYHNRTAAKPWLSFINKKLDGYDLELQKGRFNLKDVKAFGLMYLESPIPKGSNLSQ